jgi:exopolysaccharide biosynthesis polyprenyl glycosylphosphotransferase
LFVHTIQRKLLEKGIGRRKTLIVGWGKKAWELFDQVLRAPALGYEIVGFVIKERVGQKKSYQNVPIAGELKQLNRIIKNKNVDDILIALSRRSERQLEEVIAQCNGLDVGIKIVPDLYDVIVGQVRTNQIYGFPLIEILPQLIAPWERIVKRIIDIFFSFFVLIGFLPLWIIIAVLIKLSSKGSVFYLQERVGKDGVVFKIFKFRSMVEHAEKRTGPVWASDNDPRVTIIGKWLRKLRLDEVPQLINVLCGDMSLVGPRPERPFFVEKLKKIYPLYTRRMRIRPGITGWAQVKGEYDQNLEQVKQKLEYDLFYLENMSIRMDLKIILNTIYFVLTGRGQ